MSSQFVIRLHHLWHTIVHACHGMHIHSKARESLVARQHAARRFSPHRNFLWDANKLKMTFAKLEIILFSKKTLEKNCVLILYFHVFTSPRGIKGNFEGSLKHYPQPFKQYIQNTQCICCLHKLATAIED